MPSSFTPNTIRDVYGRSTGFGVLDSVITTGGGKSGTEYVVHYEAVTPRMSIALGIGYYASRLNNGGSESAGLAGYGPGWEYVDAINKHLKYLNAPLAD